MMTSHNDKWQWLMIGIEATVMYGLSCWYRSKMRAAEEIESLQCHEVSSDLKDMLQKQTDHTLPYVCVEGVAYPLNQPLTSQFKPSEQGIIQHTLFVEHKSKRTNGYWSEVKNVIKQSTNLCKFALASTDYKTTLPDSPLLVEVTDPLSADFLMDNLTTTYDQYTPNTETLLSRGIDRLFGEVSKGYQETEKMLRVYDKIVGVGQLVLSGGKILLEAPQDSKKAFILSTLSKKGIVTSMKSEARMIKVVMYLVGLCGVGLLAYIIHKNIRRWNDYLRDCRMYREVSQRRQARQNAMADSTLANREDSTEMHEKCVVCLQSEREVIILDCGHVCLCADCAIMLPEPRKCPICLSRIQRCVRFYTP